MKKTLIALFFLLLIFPLLFWLAFGGRFAGENYEKRALADLPTLSMETVADFPKDFEAYFSDHLPFRNQLISAYSSLSVNLLRTSSSPHVILGKKGWLFYKNDDDDPTSYYLSRKRYTDMTFKGLLEDHLIPAQQELAQRGVEFVLMIIPNKERVYPEYMPDTYGPPSDYYTAEALVRYIRENSDIHVVFPYEDLLAAKPDIDVPLYLLTDTHWNMIGGYIGARALMTELGLSLPEAQALPITDGEPFAGDLVAQLGLSETMQTDTQYRFADWPRKDCITLNDKSTNDYRLQSEGGDSRRLMIRRDSFCENMADYIGAQFADSYMIHANNYTRAAFEDYQPDIYVMETIERWMIERIVFGIY